VGETQPAHHRTVMLIGRQGRRNKPLHGATPSTRPSSLAPTRISRSPNSQ
jgi:hypothetical protein